MIDHLSSYATDFETTRAFYDTVLPTLGYVRNYERVATNDADFPTRRMCAWGRGQQPIFWVIEVKQPSSPRHVAFQAATRGAVDEFHAAGLAAGASDAGTPGPRPHYHSGYYGAFLLDPDGNNVEAVCHRT